MDTLVSVLEFVAEFWVVILIILAALVVAVMVWGYRSYNNIYVPWEARNAGSGRAYPGDRRAKKELSQLFNGKE